MSHTPIKVLDAIDFDLSFLLKVNTWDVDASVLSIGIDEFQMASVSSHWPDGKPRFSIGTALDDSGTTLGDWNRNRIRYTRRWYNDARGMYQHLVWEQAGATLHDVEVDETTAPYPPALLLNQPAGTHFGSCLRCAYPRRSVKVVAHDCDVQLNDVVLAVNGVVTCRYSGPSRSWFYAGLTAHAGRISNATATSPFSTLDATPEITESTDGARVIGSPVVIGATGVSTSAEMVRDPLNFTQNSTGPAGGAVVGGPGWDHEDVSRTFPRYLSPSDISGIAEGWYYRRVGSGGPGTTTWPIVGYTDLHAQLQGWLAAPSADPGGYGPWAPRPYVEADWLLSPTYAGRKGITMVGDDACGRQSTPAFGGGWNYPTLAALSEPYCQADGAEAHLFTDRSGLGGPFDSGAQIQSPWPVGPWTAYMARDGRQIIATGVVRNAWMGSATALYPPADAEYDGRLHADVRVSSMSTDDDVSLFPTDGTGLSHFADFRLVHDPIIDGPVIVGIAEQWGGTWPQPGTTRTVAIGFQPVAERDDAGAPLPAIYSIDLPAFSGDECGWLLADAAWELGGRIWLALWLCRYTGQQDLVVYSLTNGDTTFEHEWTAPNVALPPLGLARFSVDPIIGETVLWVGYPATGISGYTCTAGAGLPAAVTLAMPTYPSPPYGAWLAGDDGLWMLRAIQVTRSGDVRFRATWDRYFDSRPTFPGGYYPASGDDYGCYGVWPLSDLLDLTAGGDPLMSGAALAMEMCL